MSLKEFREIVFNTASEILLNNGFKLVKIQRLFKKSIGNSLVDVSFDIINYYPRSFEYTFICAIWIHEIQEVLSEFHRSCKIDGGVLWSTVLFEGDFVPDLKNREYVYRSGFYREVSSRLAAHTQLRLTMETLRLEAIPFSSSMSDLQTFQGYYFTNRHEISKNLGNSQLIKSVLVAAYLKGRLPYDDLYSYCQGLLENEGKGYQDLYSQLQQLNNFLTGKFKS